MEEVKHEKEQLKYNIETELLEQRKQKIKSWLKDKYNLYFLGVMIIAIAIRLYYFSLTMNQPLWWDEAEYLSFARDLVFDIPYKISPQRVVFFPFLASLLYLVGLGEIGIKFSLVLLPSILVILVTYLFVKEMYNKKIALLATLITSVCWIHLFYSMRIMNDEIGFLFGLLALWFFWKGYIFNKNNKYVYLSAFFIGLAFLMRPAGIFYGGIIFLFVLMTEQLKFLRKPQLWIMVLVFLLTLSPHLVWSHFYHGNALAFRSAYSGLPSQELGWNIIINTPLSYTGEIFFIFFIIGLFSLAPLFLNFDRVLRGEKKYYNDAFMLISILFILLVVGVYVLRGGEDRWLMAASIGLFVFASKGILLVFDIVKRNLGKIIAVIAIIILISLGIYAHPSYDFLKGTKYSLEQKAQLNHADAIIKNKIESYAPVKEAAFWIKANSKPEDIIFSRSRPQNTYYSDRETITFDYSLDKIQEEELLNLLKERKPKFFVLSIFESHPQWMFQIPQRYPEAFIPVQAYQDQSNQPLLVIYEINYTGL